MSKNSAQQGNKEQGNDSQPINHQPYGQEVWGPDGKGNIYYFEASAAPMKSRVVTLDDKGAHTDYVNQSWELRAGDKLNDDICVLIDAVKGKITIIAEKSSIDIRARENINLHSDKGDINLNATNGKIVLNSKDLMTGDLAGGKKPKIMMNSRAGGNFCGAMLPHKLCWDFVGPMVAAGGGGLFGGSLGDNLGAAVGAAGGIAGGPAGSMAAGMAANAISSAVGKTSMGLAASAASALGEPFVPNPIERPFGNGDICNAWKIMDRRCSPPETESDSGVDYY